MPVPPSLEPAAAACTEAELAQDDVDALFN
jgi:hypothetical protein